MFDISHLDQKVLSLDSEQAPDALALDADLLQGSYAITLHDGWRLERLGDAGAASVISAALLTPNPQNFDVQNARVTELVYSFTTDQGIVSFGSGSASVSVTVTSTAPTSSCSVLDRSTCPAGQTCLYAGDSGRTFCAEPGNLPVSASCSSDQCVAGAQCLSLDPAHPEARVCSRFCNPNSTFCGCQGTTVDPTVGVCTVPPPPGVVFSHAFNLSDTQGACSEWGTFRSQLIDPNYARVSLSGLGGSFECTDPGAATQICAALHNDSFSNISCQGHTWSTNNCNDQELSVDNPFSCCNSLGNTLRACNGTNFGGIGTNTCNPVPQTIEVVCETARAASVCGNGVIEHNPPFSGTNEVCDTNGTGQDMLPPGTPVGSTCNSTCTAILPPDSSGPVCGNGIIDTGEACDGVHFPAGTPTGSVCDSTCTQILPGGAQCISCAKAKCVIQYNNALGTASDAANLADVTSILSCVIGPDFADGRPIPQTSCFFADPTQPGGSLLPCYCGSTPFSTCIATGPADHTEACGVQIETASRCNPVTASCVTASGSDPANALGDTAQLLNCERGACPTECGFPIIDD